VSRSDRHFIFSRRYLGEGNSNRSREALFDQTGWKRKCYLLSAILCSLQGQGKMSEKRKEGRRETESPRLEIPKTHPPCPSPSLPSISLIAPNLVRGYGDREVVLTEVAEEAEEDKNQEETHPRALHKSRLPAPSVVLAGVRGPLLPRAGARRPSAESRTRPTRSDEEEGRQRARRRAIEKSD
jgi:hypothetical protein